MKFSNLKKLFSREYPEGTIQRIKHKTFIHFKPGSKMYEYSGTNYAIAERLDLIPHHAATQIARRITIALQSTSEVIDLAGIGDVIQYHWKGKDTFVNEEYPPDTLSVDEYGRALALYRVAKNADYAEWSSTIP